MFCFFLLRGAPNNSGATSARMCRPLAKANACVILSVFYCVFSRRTGAVRIRPSSRVGDETQSSCKK